MRAKGWIEVRAMTWTHVYVVVRMVVRTQGRLEVRMGVGMAA